MKMPPKDEKKRAAALYVRVSTDAQREEGYSIEAQQEMLVAYCVSRGIREHRLYIDGGFSGSNMERPEMTRLIADIRLKRISHVIVYKLDRLSRSQKDTLYLIEDVLIPNGVSFVSLNENMDTATPIGRAMLGIMSAFAQLERETIRERTRMGMRERVKSGLWPGGGKIPFGYNYDAERGILVPNADADTVRLMYDLYRKGWSMMAIARCVGLKYERLAEQILRRKTNAGYIVYNGEEYRGRHDAIVPLAVYEDTIRLMEERSRGERGAVKHLLAGMVECGVCGAKMRYQKWGKAGYKIYCYSQDKGKPHLSRSEACDNHKIWAHELEETVIGDLFAMSSREIGGGQEPKGKGIDRLLTEQVEKLERKLKNLYHLYGDSGDEALVATIDEVRGELASAKERLSRFLEEEGRGRRGEAMKREIRSAEAAWPHMTVAEKRNVLRSCIEKIVVTYDRIDLYYKVLTESSETGIL
ncbi:MAG: recombinase family protein [Clostridia bacterium]|nr:recombinase family protein [Clostridia bacterium]